MEKQLDTHNKYQTIESFHQLLVKEGIPHEYVPILDGMQCIFYYQYERVGDFVEHFGSYGLESMGFDLDIQPYLTEQKALEIVKKYIKKVGKGNEYAATRIYN